MVEQHLANADAAGLRRYLSIDTFTHRNTDGPLNPYARVYSRREVAEEFRDFELVQSYSRYMHAPPLPVHGLPGERWLGWHLWVHLRPRPVAGPAVAVTGATVSTAGLRILVVHNRYRSGQPSGEDRVVDQECDLLRAAGHQVERFERRSDDIATMSLIERAMVPVRVPWNRRYAMSSARGCASSVPTSSTCTTPSRC